MQYAILGTHKEFSIEEIRSISGKKPTLSSKSVALYDDLALELTHLQARLGGTQKLGYIIGSIKADDMEEMVDLCSSILLQSEGDKKITFGFSTYPMQSPPDKDFYRKLNVLGLTIKKQLKETGRSVRMVTSKEHTLSSVVVTKNKLLERGAEFVLFLRGDEILIGQTETVQDFEDWSHRDFDRPRRNAKQGMLPPKLARMMINLSGVDPEGATLLDPFCGSGTLLMEGAMLGFDKLIGGDINEIAASDTEKNMAWLKKEGFDVPEVEVHTSKAENISNVVDESSVDLIVTEPFLGTLRQGRETEEMIRKDIKKLEELYEKSFRSLKKVLKDKSTIVVVSPVHLVNKKGLEPKTAQILSNLGFEQVKFETPLIYGRQGQFVKRNILVFNNK